MNYYFYGHKLKLQTGVQFADMQDRANDGGAYSRHVVDDGAAHRLVALTAQVQFSCGTAWPLLN